MPPRKKPKQAEGPAAGHANPKGLTDDNGGTEPAQPPRLAFPPELTATTLLHGDGQGLPRGVGTDFAAMTAAASVADGPDAIMPPLPAFSGWPGAALPLPLAFQPQLTAATLPTCNGHGLLQALGAHALQQQLLELLASNMPSAASAAAPAGFMHVEATTAGAAAMAAGAGPPPPFTGTTLAPQLPGQRPQPPTSAAAAQRSELVRPPDPLPFGPHPQRLQLKPQPYLTGGPVLTAPHPALGEAHMSWCLQYLQQQQAAQLPHAQLLLQLQHMSALPVEPMLEQGSSRSGAHVLLASASLAQLRAELRRREGRDATQLTKQRAPAEVEDEPSQRVSGGGRSLVPSGGNAWRVMQQELGSAPLAPSNALSALGYAPSAASATGLMPADVTTAGAAAMAAGAGPQPLFSGTIPAPQLPGQRPQPPTPAAAAQPSELVRPPELFPMRAAREGAQVAKDAMASACSGSRAARAHVATSAAPHAAAVPAASTAPAASASSGKSLWVWQRPEVEHLAAGTYPWPDNAMATMNDLYKAFYQGFDSPGCRVPPFKDLFKRYENDGGWWPKGHESLRKRLWELQWLHTVCLEMTAKVHSCSLSEAAQWWTDVQFAKGHRGKPKALKVLWEETVSKVSTESKLAEYVVRREGFASPSKTAAAALVAAVSPVRLRTAGPGAEVGVGHTGPSTQGAAGGQAKKKKKEGGGNVNGYNLFTSEKLKAGCTMEQVGNAWGALSDMEKAKWKKAALERAAAGAVGVGQAGGQAGTGMADPIGS